MISRLSASRPRYSAFFFTDSRTLMYAFEALTGYLPASQFPGRPRLCATFRLNFLNGIAFFSLTTSFRYAIASFTRWCLMKVAISIECLGDMFSSLAFAFAIVSPLTFCEYSVLAMVHHFSGTYLLPLVAPIPALP